IVPVNLESLQMGDQVVVRGVRDPATERAFLVEIVRTVPPKEPGARTAVDRPERFSAQKPILALVVSLLVELRQEVQILECSLLPVDDRYAIRLEIPREVGKAVLVPRRLLERALLDPAARRTARNVLHTTVHVLRSQRAISESRWSQTEGLQMWAAV